MCIAIYNLATIIDRRKRSSETNGEPACHTAVSVGTCVLHSMNEQLFKPASLDCKQDKETGMKLALEIPSLRKRVENLKTMRKDLLNRAIR